MLYGELLGRLPELVDTSTGHRDLWADEDEALAASEAAIAGGRWPSRSDPTSTSPSSTSRPTPPTPAATASAATGCTGLHPMAVNTAHASGSSWRPVRGRRYDVELRYECWVQLRSRPLRLRRDLAPLAARLQDEERGDAVWSATPVGGLTPRLTSGADDSSIAPDRFVELLVDHLRTAPPAWDPYAARS